MTLRQLWADLRTQLYEFQTLTKESRLYNNLVSSGVPFEELDSYIRNGCGRKHKNCVIPPQRITEEQLDTLLNMGGRVAGGAAIRKWLYLDEARDFDIFFSDMTAFVKGHLLAFNNPIIDICLYRNEPYELFDIDASKCSYSSSGFVLSYEFKRTMETGISDVELSAIVDPRSSLRRIAKYGESYGLKFPYQKIIMMATTSGIDRKIIDEALKYAV